MQENYVSLNPEHQKTLYGQTDRMYLYNKRIEDAQGGPAAIYLGHLLGITGALFTYNYYAKNGFTLTPLAKYKLP